MMIDEAINPEELTEIDPTEELVQPDNPLPEIGIDDLPEPLRVAANGAGWTEFTRVQATAIPYVLEERDIMVQSRTGSGKTGAFILPLLEKLDPAKAHCQALILVPTRELAQQVVRESQMLGKGTDVRTVAVYGGVGYGEQLEGFKKGAHIVVGTAGRILDHLIRGSLNLKHLQVLIFDEADRMMSMGSYPDMREIASFLSRDRASFMFSATFPESVKRLAKQFLKEPGFLSLSHDSVHVTNTEHFYYMTPGMDKDRALIRIIEIENPESAIIFCNTKVRVNYINTVIQRFGYDSDMLTSDLSQKARDKVLDRLRRHDLRFLVATDVAARGIDITNLSHVFNYEIPEDPESYVHRTGRTGRAGASGVAFSLVSPTEKLDLDATARRFELDIDERPLPTDEDVQNIVSQRLTGLLEARLRKRSEVELNRFEELKPLARTLSESEEKIALLAMVLDCDYQESLHSGPETVDKKKERPAPTDEEEGAVDLERLMGWLETQLKNLDRIKLERLERLKPLARALSESEDEIALLAMALDEFYQECLHSPPQSRDKKRSRPPRREHGQGGGGDRGQRPRGKRGSPRRRR